MDKIRKNINKHSPIAENKVQKVKSRQKKKPKEKVEKKIIFAARTRLEPRLSLPCTEKNKAIEETVCNVEKNKRLVISLNANEVAKHLEHDNLKEVLHLKSPTATGKANEKRKISEPSNVSPLKKKNDRVSLGINDNFGDDDFQSFIKESTKHRNMLKGMYWTDKEIKDLAYGLQQYGFNEVEKIAAEIKTKTVNDIKVFLKTRTLEKRKAKTVVNDPDRHRGRPKNSWTTVSHENLQTWPTVRKWRRLAYEQMLSFTRTKDYSRPVISALCNKFYEEEPEPADPQVINVKLIYKYISDCMLGSVPPQLPPKESALVLDLLRELRLMPIAYDFEEERQFLKDFRRATTFKPFHVKDEFKKRIQQAPEEMSDVNAVSVPEEVFLELSRHKRLLQSFNPLVTPVWMVQKEQEYLQNYFEESSVYVD